MSDLTLRQKQVLQWIATNNHHRARWLRNGRHAYGEPETWDAFELAGHGVRIRISKPDWQAVQPYLETVGGRDRFFSVKATPNRFPNDHP